MRTQTVPRDTLESLAFATRATITFGPHEATVDVAGVRFRSTIPGRIEGTAWIVLGDSQERPRHVIARCDCGTERHLLRLAMFRGDSRSCGCLNRDVIGTARRTHGMTGTPTHRSWAAMLTRCTNPKVKSFANYGGRGIQVCDEWRDFLTFLRDMGERPEGTTLDRIDPDGNYEPANCRWATRSEQNANKRVPTKCRNGHDLTADGATVTVYDKSRGRERRRCRACQVAAEARYAAKRRAS